MPVALELNPTSIEVGFVGFCVWACSFAVTHTGSRSIYAHIILICSACPLPVLLRFVWSIWMEAFVVVL